MYQETFEPVDGLSVREGFLFFDHLVSLLPCDLLALSSMKGIKLSSPLKRRHLGVEVSRASHSIFGCNSWPGQQRGFPVYYRAIFHEFVEEFPRSKPALASSLVVE